ncbi:MAG: tetratricopeptide repeat protein [bacterium]
MRIDLLKALFLDGEERPPRLKDEAWQAWTLNELANSYSLSGQPQKAVPLFERQIAIREKQGVKKSVAIGLGNLASTAQIPLGELKAAESNLRRSINLCQEIKDEFWEAVGHQELGRLLAYQGNFSESEKELERSTRYWEKIDHKQGLCLDEAYRSLRALLMEDADSALKEALRARELADVRHYERDIIRAEWLIGSAYLAKGDLNKAESHLNEAIIRDRRINLVELEPDILLAIAKLRFAQGHRDEAEKLAKEALDIATRCEYRLKQADIHIFLAEFYLSTKDPAQAREDLELAKERAACGYQPALNKAKLQ